MREIPMKHRHPGKYKSRTPKGRIVHKRRPLHKYGTIKRGKVKFELYSPQHKFLLARKLPHSIVTVYDGKKRIKRVFPRKRIKKKAIWFGKKEEPEDFEEQLEGYKEERERRLQSALYEDPELIEQLAFETAKGMHRTKREMMEPIEDPIEKGYTKEDKFLFEREKKRKEGVDWPW